MRLLRKHLRQSQDCRSLYTEKLHFKIHPLFWALGVWYACTGELFLFLLSAIVAIQHECAHAFAAARLGYRLRNIILMPFGAVIDGDMQGIGFKEEIFVAACGPLCNLITAAFFVAIWWFEPTMYAFTDTAYYASLAIALVNLLPAYPLDGGRILRCALVRHFLPRHPDVGIAKRKAEKVCRGVTLSVACVFLALFLFTCTHSTPNLTLLLFSLFLTVGAFGNRDKSAVYSKMDFTRSNALKRGVEIRHVAVLETCSVKKALRFISEEYYLLLEVYDEKERLLFSIPQNEFADLFMQSQSPHDKLGTIYRKIHEKRG